MSLDQTYFLLERLLDSEVRRAEPMSKHTTYRIGGPAALFITCDSIHDLTQTLDVLAQEQVSRVVLGRGSNVLVSDEGYEGAVIVLGKEFRRHSIQDGHLQAGAGANLTALVRETYSKGISGMEFAAGIPGTLGGALAMNAGSRNEWIQGVVDGVTLLVPEEGLVRLQSSDVEWGYRSSNLSGKGVIIECDIRVTDGDSEEIRRKIDDSFTRRKASQPVGSSSAGSVFVNPEGDSAGRLIESLGFKGRRDGGAKVSDIHANFIVNEGGATARDVLSLVRSIQLAVKDRYGIELQTEIKLLGQFEDAQEGSHLG